MRDLKYDNMKGILMILVLVGHTLTYYKTEYHVFTGIFLFVYLFHMGAFMFTSGLFANRTVDNNRIWKITPYILIYFILKFAFAIVARIFTENYYPEPFFREDGSGWYMLCLFFCYLICMAVKRFKPAYVMTIAVILSMFAGFSQENPDVFVWMKVVTFFPFFYIGYLVDPKKLAERLDKLWIKLCSLGCFAVIMAICIRYEAKLYKLRPILTGRNPYSDLEKYAELGPVLRVLWIVANVVIILMLISLTPKGKNVLTILGQRTLGIYCTHYVIIKVIYDMGYENFLINHFPDCWKALVWVTLAVVLVISANPYTDRLLRKLFDSSWKLRVVEKQ